MSQQRIIDNMSALQQTNVDYKIAPPESLSIIGSNSINTGGGLYVMSINSVSKPSNKRSKRLFDLSAGIAMLLLLPLMIFIVKNPPGLAGNILKVLLGIRSWVGYCHYALNANVNLPHIRKGILNPADGIVKHDVPADIAESLNILYSKDYSVTSDVRIFLRNIRKLGRKI
jgi:lipopolysaccharide/colanic/teichoic acid biosynthesis glycosyltransferase